MGLAVRYASANACRRRIASSRRQHRRCPEQGRVGGWLAELLQFFLDRAVLAVASRIGHHLEVVGPGQEGKLPPTISLMPRSCGQAGQSHCLRRRRTTRAQRAGRRGLFTACPWLSVRSRISYKSADPHCSTALMAHSASTLICFASPLTSACNCAKDRRKPGPGRPRRRPCSSMASPIEERQLLVERPHAAHPALGHLDPDQGPSYLRQDRVRNRARRHGACSLSNRRVSRFISLILYNVQCKIARHTT